MLGSTTAVVSSRSHDAGNADLDGVLLACVVMGTDWAQREALRAKPAGRLDQRMAPRVFQAICSQPAADAVRRACSR